MRLLSRRWEPLFHVDFGQRYRTFLSEVSAPADEETLAWGCIETYGPTNTGPYRLEIWNAVDEEWEFVRDFPTIKEAKEVGRLLAGVALAKNF
jgi:hypothetical protein